MGYPDYMYQQYQYYAMANQYGTPLPYININMNGYSPRKKHNKNNHGLGYYGGAANDYSKNPLWSSHSNSPVVTPSDVTPSPPELSEAHGNNEVEARPVEQKPEPEPKAEQPAPEKKPDTFPLLFNTSLDEFGSDRKEAAKRSQQLIASKSERLDSFLAQVEVQVQGDVVINPHTMARIVDHNSNHTYLKRIYQNPDQGSKTYDNDTNDSASAQRPLTSNWASFLQTTVKKVPKKGPLMKTSNLTGAAPASAPAQAANTSNIPVSSSLPQPLGVLAMKILFDPEFHLEDCDSFLIKPRGLTNSGNICYMNAVLQCLIFCDPFSKTLRFIQEKAIGNLAEVSPTPLIDATIQFINDVMNVPALGNPNGSVVNSDGIVVGRPLSPEGLYMKLIENTKFLHLKWGQQEDAEEFLGYFLDGLHEEFVKVESTVSASQMEKYYQEFSRHLDSKLAAELKSKMKEAVRLVSSSEQKQSEQNEVDDGDSQPNGWSEVGSGKRVSKKRIVEVEPSPITHIFGGQFRSVLTIPKSKESQSITVDPFRCILVDISQSDVDTIEDAFWKFNEEEKLPYKIDDREVIARKQTFIDELPNVLTLQLKRFSYQHEQGENRENDQSSEGTKVEGVRGMGTIEKVMKDIKFGLNLTIPPECLSPAVRSSQKREYRLMGAIYHHGRNAEGGHYTCDVRRDGRKWLRIDDTAVESIDADSVIEKPTSGDKSAYILMYERIQ